jgi:NADH-quinone oxidoreductase subunit N
MLQAGFIALVIVAVINSIISVGYYFKVILAMYKNLMKKDRDAVVIYAVAVIAIVLNIALGLFPSFVLDLA